MKKIIILLGVVCLFTLALSFKNYSNQRFSKLSRLKILSKPKGITLNGTPWIEANTMVSSFINNSVSSNNRTAIWLSKTWVDSVWTLLSDEYDNNVGTDGFRIYFAKKDSGQNTIVIVSTKYDGENPKSESKSDHLDYYEHATKFLNSSAAKFNEDYIGEKGARLYESANPCKDDSCSINTINFISCNEAFSAVKNFNSKTINVNSEWFSLGLLDYLHNELAFPKSDGIRIYFARTKINLEKSSHINRNCFIIVTTETQDGGKTHEDYFKCHTGKQNLFGSSDNGEQCPNNCNGVTLPKP